MRQTSNGLIILGFDLEEALGMSADGADTGGLLADDQMTAVTALPHDFLGLLKDLLHLNIVQQSQITGFVSLFNLCDHTELSSQSGEALFLGLLG